MKHDPEMIEMVARAMFENSVGPAEKHPAVWNYERDMYNGLAQAALDAAFEWRDIETAPRDGTPHVRGLYVHQKRVEMPDFVYWDAVAGFVNDYGEFQTLSDDDCGWAANAFTHWLPLPTPPEED